MLPVPTVSYLAQFTGRDEGSFTAFADQALIQATLLFSIVTRREEYPADEDQEALAINAVLEMADRIYLEQPFATYKASPFQSETIASYTYSKGSYVTRAKDGQPTGLFWWDLAVDELSLASSSLMSHASVYAFEDAVSAGTDGDRFILTPGDVADVTWLGVDDNVELRPRPRLG
jgi:hypothetical protein